MNHKRFKNKLHLIVPSLLIVATLACSLGGTTDAPPPTPDPTSIVFTVTGGERIVVNNQPIEVASISMSADSIIFGQDGVTATVTLTAAAPEDMSLLVGTNGSRLLVPDTVTVPSGESSVSFPVAIKSNASSIPTSGSPTYESIAAKAYENGQQKFFSLRLNNNSITGFGLNDSATGVLTGTSYRVNISRFGQAPSGGEVITLSSSDPNVATVPASVTVPSGNNQANFMLEAKSVQADTSVTLTATQPNGNYRRLTITIVANGIAALSFDSPVADTLLTTATITLAQAAPAGGAEVTIDSFTTGWENKSGNVTCCVDVATGPANVFVPEGQTTATFTLTPVARSFDSQAWTFILPRYNGTVAKKEFKVLSNRISAIALDTNSIIAGESATATVTLMGPAKSGGVTVNLGTQGNYAIDDSFAIIFPYQTGLTVPEGQTTATFSIQSHKYTSPNSSFPIKASYGGAEKQAALAVNQNTVDTFVIEPAAVVGGNSINGTVTLMHVAPADTRINVGLTGSSPTGVVTLPTNVIVPSGQKTITFSMQTQQQTSDRSVTLTAAVNWPPPGSGGTLQYKNATVQVQKQGTVLPTNTPTTAPTGTTAPTATPTKTRTPTVVSTTTKQTATVTPTLKLGVLSSLTFDPTSAKGGSTVNLHIKLSGAAPVGGKTITFKSDSSALKAPANVTIKQGGTGSTLAIKLPTVTTKISITLTANDGTINKSSTITVTP
jgi:hypothetical protein